MKKSILSKITWLTVHSRSVVFFCLVSLTMMSAATAQISVVNKNGAVTSDALLAVDKYGAIGSGKGISRFGGIIDAPLAPKVAGETYQGGTIFYLLVPGDTGYDANVQHGLIRTDRRNYPFAEATTVNWVVSTGLPNDNANNLFGYNDWRLPTIGEATKICETGVLRAYDYTISSTDSVGNSTSVQISSTYADNTVCNLSNTSKTGAYGGIRTILVRSF